MKLIVISSSRHSSKEPLVVTKLFESGLDTFHLRKPKFTTKELKHYIEQIPKHFHNRIVIHSHHNLARKFRLKGIHITKTHKRKKFKTALNIRLLKIKNPKLIVSTSYSKLASIYEDNPLYDYVFLSPIFDHVSSKYQSGFTEYSLKKAIEKTNHQIIARGGVDINSLEKVKEIGFAGMAIYSGIWKKEDPLQAFNEIIEKCNELEISID